MAGAETTKNSGKASGESRPHLEQTRRKARFTSSLQGLKVAIALGLQAMLLLPFSYAASISQSQQALQASDHSAFIHSALTRSQYEGYAPSQSGTDPVAPWLAFSGMPLAVGVSPPLFAASQSDRIINRSALIESDGDMKLTAGVITNTRRTLTMSGVFDQPVDPAVISALNISMSGTTGQTNVHNASSIGGVHVEPPHGGSMNSDYFYTSLDLVILDELGYWPFGQSGGAFLFHLLSKLYEHTSVMITTHLDFAEWASVFGQHRLASSYR